MTVPIQTTVNSYTSAGTSTFVYSFQILLSSHLVVTLNGTIKSLGVDYAVTGVGVQAGGTITGLATIAGDLVVLQRVIPLTRTTDYQENGDLLAQTLDDDIDQIWRVLQQVSTDTLRALKLPTNTFTDQVIADAAATRTGKVVTFDASGNMVLALPASIAQGALISAYMQTVVVAANAAAARALLVAAASGANTDITSLSALTIVNGGPLAGLRNKVINAAGLVQQIPAVTLTAAYLYGAVDMMMVAAVGGSAVSGSIGSIASPGFSKGVGYGAVSAGWTTGVASVQHRLYSKNVSDLNSKTVMVSGKLYQDFGGSRNCTVSLYKPTALDNHTAQTLIATSPTFACAFGSVTSFSFSTTLGAADATNGLAIIVADSVANTVVSKSFVISDLQLELGSVASSPETVQRPVELELSLCKFYRQWVPLNAAFTAAGASQSQESGITWPEMRIAPTIAVASADPNATQSTANNLTNDIVRSTPYGGSTRLISIAAGNCACVGYRVLLTATL